MAKVWARIRETIERHGAAGLLSVVGAAGSVPREAGARIVLQPDGGFYGSIGGGRLEYEAIAAARKALRAGRGAAQFRDWPLGPNLGQCCGGMVKTLIETFDRNDMAAVRRLEAAEKAGAFVTASRVDDDGRIARLLAPPAAAGKHDDVTAARSPSCRSTSILARRRRRCCCSAPVMSAAPSCWRSRRCRSPCAGSTAGPISFRNMCRRTSSRSAPRPSTRELAEAPRDAMIIVMTHSHPLDFDITVTALRRRAFDFVGLIGSDTKRARFVSFARQMGVAESDIDRLVCPIGVVEIKGKEPAVIAAALAAQLLIVSEQVSATQPSPAIQPA